jgi:hypothetical protein
LPPGIIYSVAEQAGVNLDHDLLEKMEQELRKQNVRQDREMREAVLIKTKKMPSLSKPDVL